MPESVEARPSSQVGSDSTALRPRMWGTTIWPNNVV